MPDFNLNGLGTFAIVPPPEFFDYGAASGVSKNKGAKDRLF